MIFGIGIDAVELYRVEEIIQKNSLFIKRVLTPLEYVLFEKHSNRRKVEFLAGRFACKEAFSKAYGTGIGQVTFQELEILRDEFGKPIFTASPFAGKVHVSITHTKTTAYAQVILES